jgi:hypothetical protein
VETKKSLPKLAGSSIRIGISAISDARAAIHPHGCCCFRRCGAIRRCCVGYRLLMGLMGGSVLRIDSALKIGSELKANGTEAALYSHVAVLNCFAVAIAEVRSKSAQAGYRRVAAAHTSGLNWD